MISILNHRIRQLRQKAGMTLAELATKLNVKEATAQRYESGEIKNIKLDTIKKIADIFECSPAYLIGWEDSVISTAPASSLLPVTGSVKAGWNSIPVAELVGYEPAYGLTSPEDYTWLEIKGDSMEPLICDGDLALIKLQSFASNSDIVVAIIDEDEGTLKKFRQDEHGIMLSPLNNFYETRFIPASDAHRLIIYGIAVEIKRKLR